jgi:hypothetical protein
MSRIANVVVFVVVMQALTGCGSSPTQPEPIPKSPPSAPRVFYRVRGFVTDSALRPVVGAVVEILDGPQPVPSVLTTSGGYFDFLLEEPIDDQARVRVVKQGYAAATGTPASVRNCDACQPFWWLDFHLESLVPTVNLVGNYTLTFVADSACTAIPSAVRTRTYAATITPISNPPYPAGTSFEATITGVPVWGQIQRSIPLLVSGDFVTMMLGEDGDVIFFEEVAPDTYFGFEGQVGLSVAAGVSTISASFHGWAEYWGPDGAPRVYCESPNHRMTLTKR